MFESLTGIVLRTFVHGRLCIFTRQLGKIFCAIKGLNIPLPAGSIIVTRLIKKNIDSFQVDHLQSVTYPNIQAPHELVWLHHIIELYYFFMSEQQPSPRDFDFFEHYLTLTKAPGGARGMIHLQELAVSHFLAQTGFYEQPALHRYAKIFEKVIDPSVEHTVRSCMISSDEASIQDLILRCLQEHPQFHRFKTIPFLYRASTQ